MTIEIVKNGSSSGIHHMQVPFVEASKLDAAIGVIVALIAAAMLLLLALYLFISGRKHSIRYTIFTTILALLYPLAGFNTVLVERFDGAHVNYSAAMLNTFFWIVVLREFVSLSVVDTQKCAAFKFFLTIIPVAMVMLTFLSQQATIYGVVMSVLGSTALFVIVTMIYSRYADVFRNMVGLSLMNNDGDIPNLQDRHKFVVIGVHITFVGICIVQLIVEFLSPTFFNILSVGVAYIAMFACHIVICLLQIPIVFLEKQTQITDAPPRSSAAAANLSGMTPLQTGFD